MTEVYSALGSKLVRDYRRRFSRDEERQPRDPGAALQGEPEHELVITGVPRSNGRRLRVRCRCMAEYRGVSRRYYNYDPLGEVNSLDEVRELYSEHLAESEKELG